METQLATLKKNLAAPPKPRRSAFATTTKPTALEKELYAETAKALRALDVSSLRGKSSEEINAFLRGALPGPHFARMNDLVAKHRALPADEVSFPIKAITLGIDGSLEFIIGVQGSVGVAVSASDPLDFSQDALYATGTLVEGIDEGGLGGGVIGFWKEAPADLGGWSYGFEIEIDDIVGGYVEASYTDLEQSTLIGVSVSADAGEEDGAEGEESYTVIWQTTPIYQPPASNYLIIQSITCDKSSELDGDEVYFKFTIDGGTTYRYPTQGENEMDTGDTWNAGRSIRFNESVYIELCDMDEGTDDDSLGTCVLRPTNCPPWFQLEGSGAKYTFNVVLNPVWKAYS